ncbi:MAG: hypothetical protein ACK4YL_23550, partial [Microcystis sp.]|uniref:hypothetical protein n=1 Tax=Microcystis sp. TaxID=1127 RepID=UPI003918E9EC
TVQTGQSIRLRLNLSRQSPELRKSPVKLGTRREIFNRTNLPLNRLWLPALPSPQNSSVFLGKRSPKNQRLHGC